MKQSKFIVGLFLPLLLAGCSDDMEVNRELPISGDEIVFGAHAENLSTPQSRTIYGLPDGEEGNFGNYTALTISWDFDEDQVRVYSPQASLECQYADYTVRKTEESSEAYLEKNGDIGVRWGDTSQDHTFYAFYPLDKIKSGLQGEKTVTANIPVAQERGALLTSETNPDVITDKSWKIIAPDMSYCMMAGTGTWQTTDVDKNVALKFTPLVSVLDVVVNGPAAGEASRNIVSISVRSKTQDIVGDFTYNYEENEFTFPTSSGDNKIATVSCVQGEGSGTTPTVLGPGEKLNVKFFLLPRDIDADELSISVLMEGGYVQTQSLSGNGTASGGGTGDGVLASGKITRVITPKLSLPSTNNWMSLIGDNVLFSQLSLPGSKQSYTGSMEVNTYNPETDITQKYQDLYVATDGHGKTQFDAGIRAFDVDLEVQNDNGIFEQPDYNAYVYSGTGKVNNPNTGRSMTLSDVLNALDAKIRPNGVSEYTEGVVVFFNFVNNNVESSQWATTVMDEIRTWSGNHDGVLQQLTPSTTMQDMRGKIAVIMNLVNPNDPTPDSPINYIEEYGTGRQNLTIQMRKYNGGGTNVYIQNLMQVNNPTITSDPGTFGWRDGVGLVPYYITEAVSQGTTLSLDLIETKANLMSQLIEQIKTDGGQSMFINDLSGFCVVEQNNSTGWSGYRIRTYERGIIWNSWSEPDATMLYDYQDLPNRNDYDYFGADEPERANLGDTWLQFPYGANTAMGNGGNTGAFAEQFNARATQAIADLVETGRTPMGIVLMNFAGSATVTLGNNTYQVQGIRLPGLVMSNNFLFELKTADGK